MDITEKNAKAFFDIHSEMEDRIQKIGNRVMFGEDTDSWEIEEFYLTDDILTLNLKDYNHYSDGPDIDYEWVEFPADLVWKENGLDEALDIGKERATERKKKKEKIRIQEEKKAKEKQKMWNLEEYKRLKSQLRQMKTRMEKADE